MTMARKRLSVASLIPRRVIITVGMSGRWVNAGKMKEVVVKFSFRRMKMVGISAAF